MDSTGQEILDWWLTSFDGDDRNLMVSMYSPLTLNVSITNSTVANGANPLIDHMAGLTRETAFYRLSSIATWYSRPGYSHWAISFAKKAMGYAEYSTPILDRHFGLHNQCVVTYRWRDSVDGAFQAAVEACEASVSIHEQAAVEAAAAFGQVPAHHCFQQLRIIEEKRGNYERAIQLCEMAKRGSWAGDWDKDIARLSRKKDKSA
ncbi:hypothetical protein [Sphingobium sp. WCS2017Hpa-17]|uniref:hypothetical protein n=1 Tax=Sphingobium sp. WCS2017Hpa-17 TaxID=3073638 RepID=UPI0028895243|nr:hypothetical protein [Sphingobium sp. WCS2017Hpa-17]